MKEPLYVQVGSVLYEASKARREVTKWVVLDIYIKNDATPKTVVAVWSTVFGRIEKSPETVCCWHSSRARAKECLEEMLA